MYMYVCMCMYIATTGAACTSPRTRVCNTPNGTAEAPKQRPTRQRHRGKGVLERSPGS